MLGHKRVSTENLVIGGVEVELVLWESIAASPTPLSWAWYATLGEEGCGRAFGVAMTMMQASATEKVRQKAEDDARKEISAYWRAGAELGATGIRKWSNANEAAKGMVPAPQCRTCRWWRGDRRPDDEVAGLEAPCSRHAPGAEHVPGVPGRTNGFDRLLWPMTGPSNGCGDHEPSPEHLNGPESQDL